MLQPKKKLLVISESGFIFPKWWIFSNSFTQLGFTQTASPTRFYFQTFVETTTYTPRKTKMTMKTPNHLKYIFPIKNLGDLPSCHVRLPEDIYFFNSLGGKNHSLTAVENFPAFLPERQGIFMDISWAKDLLKNENDHFFCVRCFFFPCQGSTSMGKGFSMVKFGFFFFENENASQGTNNFPPWEKTKLSSTKCLETGMETGSGRFVCC